MTGGDFTRRLLTDSGIGSGMRVLDVGCGTGDVALLVAERVGAAGAVVGIDRDPGPLAAGRVRAREAGRANVSFVRGDLGTLSPGLGSFDAIVGRRVLMYQPDATEAVRGLARALHPGGVIVFQEHDTTMAPASPAPMPLHRDVQRWLRQMIEREGADLHMGFNIHAALTEAGLVVLQVRAEAVVQTPDAPYHFGAIVRACLPRIVGLGVATEAEVGIETLQQRLDAERLATGATYVGDVMFGAWARKPV